MKKSTFLRAMAIGMVAVSALSILMVSAMAFTNPQSVMDLVGVRLPNSDALSSIRGIYGGAGLTIVIMLIYLAIRNLREALGLLALLWGFYALSRGITHFAEGPLGDFGMLWIHVEGLLCGLSLILLMTLRRKPETV